MNKYIRALRKDTVTAGVVLLLAGLLIVSFLGVLAPELAFDALWYHLTFPKLYLTDHAISYIPGGLMYYSAMPKLTEMFYTIALSFGSELYAKLVHFTFGLFTLYALYRVCREFFSQKISLLVVLLFSSNLVFLWEMTTSYIDISRTFYELMALWGYVLWRKTNYMKYFVLSALMVGFAITTKLLAIGTVGIFIGLLFISLLEKRLRFFHMLRLGLMYISLAFIVPLPWFLFAYTHTGNPFYPVFSGYDATISWSLLSLSFFINDFVTLFLFADDPISPIYLICLPLAFFIYKKLSYDLKQVIHYSLLAFLVWYVTPRTGGGRFILPYLPAFSIVVGAVIAKVGKYEVLMKTLMVLIFFIAISSISYRSMAVMKYMSVITGSESKQQFLSENLNFSYGDFYDIDGYFVRTITSADRVLLFGFHNLYYVDFPFIHATWVTKGDKFNYIATQHDILPARFATWKLVYQNKKTGVTVYTDNKEFVRY